MDENNNNKMGKGAGMRLCMQKKKKKKTFNRALMMGTFLSFFFKYESFK